MSSKAKQNDRFAVVLKIHRCQPEYGHIMVSDYLPAGLEIRQPDLGLVQAYTRQAGLDRGRRGAREYQMFRTKPNASSGAAIDCAGDDKSVFACGLCG